MMHKFCDSAARVATTVKAFATGSSSFAATLSITVLSTLLAACASSGAGAPNVVVRPLANGSREMTADQQIRHAISRLTFGPRAGDYEMVRREGLDRWVGEQLAPASVRDDSAEAFVAHYAVLSASETALATMYGLPGDLRRQGAAAPDTAAIRAADIASNQIIASLRGAKVARAVLSRRQLREVMTDFWENHFSIFAEKGADKYMLVDYDDSVRAHSLGKFRGLLGTVAHSPAMLYYLDNWTSRADSDRVTLADVEQFRRRASAQANYEKARSEIFVDRAGHITVGNPGVKAPPPYKPSIRHGKGLNENYGRELMELHTLGVDGGYTQADVIEAARILTGWTLKDPNHIGTFYFNPGMHDAGQKEFLGYAFPAGHGEDEGERLLDIIARRPATAHFIALKLCRRFLADSPSTDLVNRAAATFTRTDGDIAEVMRTIIGSPEFFSLAAYRAKVKSPFEVAVSSLRALNATPDTLQRDVQAVARLGEPLWGHLAPDGYPETGGAWLNTGSILNRINFGIQIAAGQIPGASVNTWPPTARLINAPRAVQVDTVVYQLFGGDVSPQTRTILDQGSNPIASAVLPAAAIKQQSQNQLVQILGLALGAPEFQRR
ncbi:MAG: DUF1800 domain-containing protein [Gemmatimonadota bacterium]|nr:DUF1800 domain-containing protein [Gemmatimonadota bacterium]